MTSKTDYQAYKDCMRKKENFPLKDFESLLIEKGFTFRGQEGSHKVYKNHASGVMISLKNEKIISIGVLRKELQKVFPNWNVKPTQETKEEQGPVTKFELTEEMISLAFELSLDIDTITESDYNTLKELTK